MGLADSLVAFWKLDETSGTRADAFASNDLSDNNTVTTLSSPLGSAAQFTAANSEFLQQSSGSDLNMGDIDFTLCAWVLLDTKNTDMTIIGKWNNTDKRQYLLMYNAATDRLQCVVSNDGTDMGATTVVANNHGDVSTATWIFVVFWHDATGNTLNIQVNNGTADSIAHTGGALANSDSFELGSITGGTVNFWNGAIDAVGVWKNRALGASARDELYNSGAGMEYPFSVHRGITLFRPWIPPQESNQEVEPLSYGHWCRLSRSPTKLQG